MIGEQPEEFYTSMYAIEHEIHDERIRQIDKWGPQTQVPDGTSSLDYADAASAAKHWTDVAACNGSLTWRHILMEEVYEVLAEDNWDRIREELIQVSAVCQAWIQAGDIRNG